MSRQDSISDKVSRSLHEAFSCGTAGKLWRACPGTPSYRYLTRQAGKSTRRVHLDKMEPLDDLIGKRGRRGYARFHFIIDVALRRSDFVCSDRPIAKPPVVSLDLLARKSRRSALIT